MKEPLRPSECVLFWEGFFFFFSFWDESRGSHVLKEAGQNCFLKREKEEGRKGGKKREWEKKRKTD